MSLKLYDYYAITMAD